jgi:amino acid adenylation domain-containing protein
VRVSPTQERVWLAGELSDDVPAYRVVDQFTLHAGVAEATMAEAFALVAERHEPLRTGFRVDRGQLVQVVYPSTALPVVVTDLREAPEDRRREIAGRLFAAQVSRPLDVGIPPLWRAAAARASASEWWVLFVGHQLIADSASMLNLYAELTEICAAREQGRALHLPQLTVSYTDHAVDQRSRLDGSRHAELTAYWRAALAGAPPVHAIPTDYPRPATRSFVGADTVARIPAALTARLPAVADETGATPFELSLAAFAVLLRHLSGRDDIVIGLPATGRGRAELRPLIGVFVNMVVVRVDAGGNPDFARFAGRVREAVRAALDHQELPFQYVAAASGVRRVPGIPPVYQIVFNHLAFPGFEMSTSATEDDLMMEVSGDRVRLEYNTSIFREQTARGMADAYLRMLEAALSAPEGRLSELTSRVFSAVAAGGDSATPREQDASVIKEPRPDQQGRQGTRVHDAGTVVPRWSRIDDDSAGLVHLPVGDGPSRAASSLGVTPDAVMLAALLRVVSALSGTPDVAIGYWAPALGLVPVSASLNGGTWRDLAHVAHEEAGRADTSEPETGPSQPGAPGVSMSGLSTAGLSPAGASPAGASLAPPAGRRFDVAFGSDEGAALSVERHHGAYVLRYRRRAVDDEHAARIAGYLATAVSAISARPDDDYSPADLLGDAERRLQLDGLNGRDRTLPGRPFHELLAERAARHPDRIAATCRAASWTYGELDAAAERACQALLAGGVEPGDVVAIASGRHLGWLACVVGIFRAGGVYLPLEPAWPEGRIAAVLGRSGCRVVIADDRFTAIGVPGVRTRTFAELSAATPAGAVKPQVALRDPAYIFFTSGSTGQPKGAICEHLGMLNHLQAKVDDLRIGPGDTVVQSADLSFDISLWQLIAAFLVGARVLIVPGEETFDIARCLGTIDAHAATVAQFVPSYLGVLLDRVKAVPEACRTLREVSVTGEAVSQQLIEQWFAAFPGTRLINAYGATEVSDDTTHEIMTAPPRGGAVPVGRAIGNVAVSVLGPGDRLVPLGAPGEITFSGICVGRGYINDPERTAEAFGTDPLRPGLPMYRTGDYGRWLPGGKLGFLGRRDEQVKVNGIRLELGEVESRMREHPDVRDAAVVARKAASTGTVLAGFYTTDDGLSPDDLAAYLATVLAPGAVPATLTALDSLPLTENGKVNKKALLALAADRGLAVTSEPPRPGAELAIARCWAEVLGLPDGRIGRHDDFFALGGTSLAALKVVVALDGLIGIGDLMKHPVLADVAATTERP